MQKENTYLKAGAYAPAHITGFFKIYRNGSTGAGINIEKGVTTTVKAIAGKNKIRILINEKKKNVPTSKNVAARFLELKNGFEIEINHKTELPSGYGLGLSGASALSLSLALNRALGTGLAKKKCMEIAKKAEICEGTGLGDVVAQQFSGLMVGKKPYPSISVAKIPVGKKFVVCGFLAPLDTKKIIRSKKWKKRINALGEKCMKKINREMTLKNFVECSNHFSIETGLASKKIGSIIGNIGGACMAMPGQTVFVITNKPNNAKAELKKYTKKIVVSRIAAKGARTL